MPFKTRGSGKGPFSARYVSRQRKVGEIILPTMTAGPSGLRIPLNLSPHSSSPKLPPKNLRILTASLFTEVLQILLAWSASHSWHSPTCQGLQAPLSLPPIMPLPPTHTHTHTHTHTLPRQAFTPCFTSPAQFRTPCHLSDADSPPSDGPSRKQNQLYGGQDTNFIPSGLQIAIIISII